GLRFGGELQDLEAEWIPAASARIVGGRCVGVLNCGDPVRQVLIRSASLPLGFEIAHLAQIGHAARALKEAHRLNLHSDAAAVLVSIERRDVVSRVPQRVPRLVALCRMKCTAFLVVAFRSGEIEAFTDANVVGEEITCDGLLKSRLPGVNRNNIYDPGRAL